MRSGRYPQTKRKSPEIHTKAVRKSDRKAALPAVVYCHDSAISPKFFHCVLPASILYVVELGDRSFHLGGSVTSSPEKIVLDTSK
jgi:hypothetical protein